MVCSHAVAQPATSAAEMATVIAQGGQTDGGIIIDPTNDDAEASSEDEEKNCTWGCLRWGKFCNVDPRGVYKCRRTCERFGQ
jgi:hypothetical protein